MRVAFETFVFDTDQRLLETNGAPVHLSPKAFRLLECLIEAAPAAVSRETIYDTIWGETFVVDANLPNLISEVRTALGDSPRDPRFIRTVHRHGYSFVADLRKQPGPGGTLVVHWGSQSYPLRSGANVLGRDASCQVRIQSAGVSRMHAAIIVDGGVARVEDRGSKNGTLVGATRVTSPVVLSDGDVIRLGSVRLTFRATPATDSTLTEHVASLDGLPPGGGRRRDDPERQGEPLHR